MDAVRPVATENALQSARLLSLDELGAFQSIGEERYHHKHPFHLLMHEGKLSRGQLQAWTLNRYYYKRHHSDQGFDISLARSDRFSPAMAQARGRHDGDATSEGGIKRW